MGIVMVVLKPDPMLLYPVELQDSNEMTNQRETAEMLLCRSRQCMSPSSLGQQKKAPLTKLHRRPLEDSDQYPVVGA